MPQIVCRRIRNDLPVNVKRIQVQVTHHLVEFAPGWCSFAELTLALIATLIIDVANCAPLYIVEPQPDDLAIGEFRELVRIGQK